MEASDLLLIMKQIYENLWTHPPRLLVSHTMAVPSPHTKSNQRPFISTSFEWWSDEKSRITILSKTRRVKKLKSAKSTVEDKRLRRELLKVRQAVPRKHIKMSRNLILPRCKVKVVFIWNTQARSLSFAHSHSINKHWRADAQHPPLYSGLNIWWGGLAYTHPLTQWTHQRIFIHYMCWHRTSWQSPQKPFWALLNHPQQKKNNNKHENNIFIWICEAKRWIWFPVSPVEDTGTCQTD